MNENVRVVARIRPEPAGSTSDPCVFARSDRACDLVEPPEHSRENKPSIFKTERVTKKFALDRVFGPESTQAEIYETARPLVLSATDGYNATIFAYGHTGSGKTFTMTGENGDAGITPRAVRDIFDTMERAAQDRDAMFLVRVSYVELYNNSFRNLLEDVPEIARPPAARTSSLADGASVTSSIDTMEGSLETPHSSYRGLPRKKTRIDIRESKLTGVFLSGEGIEVGVRSEAEVRRLVRHGERVRAHGSTNCNEHSSRSHAILTVHIQKSEAGAVKVGKLHLVDLAGSERVSMSGARGDTLVEAQNINLSLALLGDVLAALSRNAKRARAVDREPVPYRNSKLTHLLKDSLGGNSKTLMLTTLRTHPQYYRQSLVSLMYASRAREIKNRTTVNVDRSGLDTNNAAESLQTMKQEMHELHRRLQQRERDFEALCAQQRHATDEPSAADLRARLQDLEAVNRKERAALEQKLSQVVHSHKSRLADQSAETEQLQQRLQERIESYQATCEQQQSEISKLRRALESPGAKADKAAAAEAAAKKHLQLGATRDEVAQMQQVVEAWQAQALTLQRELKAKCDALAQTQRDLAATAQARDRLQRGLDVALEEAAHGDVAPRALETDRDLEALRDDLRTAEAQRAGAQKKKIVDAEAARKRAHDDDAAALAKREAALKRDLEALEKSRRDLAEAGTAKDADGKRRAAKMAEFVAKEKAAAEARLAEALRDRDATHARATAALEERHAEALKARDANHAKLDRDAHRKVDELSSKERQLVSAVGLMEELAERHASSLEGLEAETARADGAERLVAELRAKLLVEADKAERAAKEVEEERATRLRAEEAAAAAREAARFVEEERSERTVREAAVAAAAAADVAAATHRAVQAAEAKARAAVEEARRDAQREAEEKSALVEEEVVAAARKRESEAMAGLRSEHAQALDRLETRHAAEVALLRVGSAADRDAALEAAERRHAEVVQAAARDAAKEAVDEAVRKAELERVQWDKAQRDALGALSLESERRLRAEVEAVEKRRAADVASVRLEADRSVLEVEKRCHAAVDRAGAEAADAVSAVEARLREEHRAEVADMRSQHDDARQRFDDEEARFKATVDRLEAAVNETAAEAEAREAQAQGEVAAVRDAAAKEVGKALADAKATAEAVAGEVEARDRRLAAVEAERGALQALVHDGSARADAVAAAAAAMKKEVAKWKAETVDLKTELAHLTFALEERSRALVQDGDARVETATRLVRLECEADLEHKLADRDDELAATKRDLERRLEAALAESALALESRLDAVREEVAAAAQRDADHHARALAAAAKELTEEWRAKVEDLKVKHAAALERERSQRTEAVAIVADEAKVTEEALRVKHIGDLRRLTRDLEARAQDAHHDATETLRTQLESVHDAEKRTLKAEAEKSLETALRDAAAEQRSATEALWASHDAATAALRADHARKMDEVRGAEEEAVAEARREAAAAETAVLKAAAQRSLEAALAAAEAAHDVAVDEIRLEHAAEVASTAEAAARAARAAAEAAAERRVEALARNFERRLEEARRAGKDAVAATAKAVEEAHEAALKRAAEDIGALCAKHADETALLRAAHTDEAAVLRSEAMDGLTELRRAHVAEVARLEAQRGADVDAFKAEAVRVAAEHTAEAEALKKASADAMKEALAAKHGEAVATYEAALEKRDAEAAESRRRFQAEAAADRAASLADVEARLAAETRVALKALRAALEAERDEALGAAVAAERAALVEGVGLAKAEAKAEAEAVEREVRLALDVEREEAVAAAVDEARAAWALELQGAVDEAVAEAEAQGSEAVRLVVSKHAREVRDRTAAAAADVEEAVAAVRYEARAKTEAAVAAERQRRAEEREADDDRFDREAADLERQFEARLDAARGKNTAVLEAAHARFAAEQRALCDAHAAEVDRLRARADAAEEQQVAEAERLQAASRADLARARREVWDELWARHRDEAAALETEWRAKLDRAVAKRDQDHGRAYARLERLHDETLAAHREAASAAGERHASTALVESHQLHRRQLHDTRKEHDEALDAVRAEFKTATLDTLERAAADHRAATQRLDDEHAADVDALKADMARNLRDLEHKLHLANQRLERQAAHDDDDPAPFARGHAASKQSNNSNTAATTPYRRRFKRRSRDDDDGDASPRLLREDVGISPPKDDDDDDDDGSHYEGDGAAFEEPPITRLEAELAADSIAKLESDLDAARAALVDARRDLEERRLIDLEGDATDWSADDLRVALAAVRRENARLLTTQQRTPDSGKRHHPRGGPPPPSSLTTTSARRSPPENSARRVVEDPPPHHPGDRAMMRTPRARRCSVEGPASADDEYSELELLTHLRVELEQAQRKMATMRDERPALDESQAQLAQLRSELAAAGETISELQARSPLTPRPPASIKAPSYDDYEVEEEEEKGDTATFTLRTVALLEAQRLENTDLRRRCDDLLSELADTRRELAAAATATGGSSPLAARSTQQAPTREDDFLAGAFGGGGVGGGGGGGGGSAASSASSLDHHRDEESSSARDLTRGGSSTIRTAGDEHRAALEAEVAAVRAERDAMQRCESDARAEADRATAALRRAELDRDRARGEAETLRRRQLNDRASVDSPYNNNNKNTNNNNKKKKNNSTRKATPPLRLSPGGAGENEAMDALRRDLAAARREVAELRRRREEEPAASSSSSSDAALLAEARQEVASAKAAMASSRQEAASAKAAMASAKQDHAASLEAARCAEVATRSELSARFATQVDDLRTKTAVRLEAMASRAEALLVAAPARAVDCVRAVLPLVVDGAIERSVAAVLEKAAADHAHHLCRALKRRDQNSASALEAALARSNARHVRRVGVALKLRDAYWQELLSAALQESDSKHAKRRALDDVTAKRQGEQLLAENNPYLNHHPDDDGGDDGDVAFEGGNNNMTAPSSAAKKATQQHGVVVSKMKTPPERRINRGSPPPCGGDGGEGAMRSEIDELKVQLDRERAARWAIVSSAMTQPIAPHLSPHVDVGSRVVAACVAGDAAALVEVFTAARLDSIECAEARLVRCDTASLLPLHRAIAGFDFHADAAKLVRTLATLLDYGADLNATDSHGETVLHKALRVCPPGIVASIVAFLLERGADDDRRRSRPQKPAKGVAHDLANARNAKGDTALHVEMRRLRESSLETVHLLLRHGADLHATDANDRTPLDLALLRKEATPADVWDPVCRALQHPLPGGPTMEFQPFNKSSPRTTP